MTTTTTNYSMYTDAANERVAKEVHLLIERIEAGEVARNDLPAEAQALCKRVSGEVWDTEPQWAIADALSAACAAQGWLPISRWDW